MIVEDIPRDTMPPIWAEIIDNAFELADQINADTLICAYLFGSIKPTEFVFCVELNRKTRYVRFWASTIEAHFEWHMQTHGKHAITGEIFDMEPSAEAIKWLGEPVTPDARPKYLN